jgi:hypothetical protein
MRLSKHLICISLALGLALSLVPQSIAQIPGLPKLYGEFKMPDVGAYATYKFTYKEKNIEQIVKLAIVGKEKSPEGEDLYWYERQETNPQNGQTVIAKMLISGNPQEIGTVHRMIFKDHKETAQELPQFFIQLMNKPEDEKSKVKEPEMKTLGSEKIRVGEKTLECTHLRYDTKDKLIAEVWANQEVPLFGVVRSQSHDLNMELMEYGTNAVTGIKEEPEQLEMPQGK